MRRVALGSAGVAALLVAFGCAGCGGDQPPPIKVGVLLPVTGEAALGYEEPLAFARDEINRAGGVRGRRVELVVQDTGTIPAGALDAPRRVWEMAKTFLADPDIDVVIGTDSDDTTFGITPSFMKAGKVLITPVAAGTHLSRAFADTGFLRRTIPSDAARAELMLLAAQRSGAQTVSVLATSSLRTASFFDWLPYHAEQLGLTVNMALRTSPGDPDCGNAIEQVYAHGAPDVLFLVPDTSAQADCMVRQARAVMPSAQLFLNDPSFFPGLFQSLGTLGDGIVGVSAEAPQDPPAGPPFRVTYETRLGHPPPPFAANVFDALALAAYGLQRADGAAGDQLAAAFDDVVKARGEVTGWDHDGMARALGLIAAGGDLPDLTGATGKLSFSERRPLELTSATFAHWHVADGVQVWDGSLSLDAENSPFEQPPTPQLQTLVEEEPTGYAPAEHKGAWAFIAAFSGGMDNYRHQADALTMYQLLKARGFTDDHIILVLADDLATASTNPAPGSVTSEVGGPNLRTADVQVDYHPADLTPADVLNILQGKPTSQTPQVIASTANDDVFVYWVGHGGDTGVLVGDSANLGEAVAGPFITPWAFAAAVDDKFQAGGYRQLVAVLDSCHAGVMGDGLTTPGALLLTGAAPSEDSYATNYDPSTNIWHADGFSAAFAKHIAAEPQLSLVDLYAKTYLDAQGSHPRLYNGGRFGGAATVTVGSIVTP